MINFEELRWELFWRTRQHRYLCLDNTKYWWSMHYKGIHYEDFPCDCDATDIRGRFLQDLIILANNVTLK